jgi:N-carbamoyl-L-amino-acid hydrolase
LIGSHLDSVIDGGRYDGVSGVLAGILLMRRVKLEGKNIPIRTVAFRCEESSNFGICTLGSNFVTRGMAHTKIKGLKDKNGKSLEKIFEEKNYSLTPPKIKGVKGYLELHIEQGRVLESNNQQVGIVTNIAGHRRFRLHIRGKAEHSGATPMNIRKDALCAASELILAIENIGKSESIYNSVATVGVLNNVPNVLNVVPGEVELLVDVRGVDTNSLDRIEKEIYLVGKQICDTRSVSFYSEKFSELKPVSLTQSVQNKLEIASQKLKIASRKMISGAGHDAINFPFLCDTGMIFISCKDGVSHNKKEFTSIESIVDGVSVLYTYLCNEEEV